MKQYVQKLTKRWWKEYAKKTGVGTFNESYDIIEKEDENATTTFKDRVIVSFTKNGVETYMLFNDYALVKVSNNIEELYNIPRNTINMTSIATDRQLSKFDKEFARSMVETHDDEYKEKSLLHRSAIRFAYKSRLETITRKSNHYSRMIDGINSGKLKKPEIAFTNLSQKVEEYNKKAKEINKVLKYQSQVEKVIENTQSTSSQK